MEKIRSNGRNFDPFNMDPHELTTIRRVFGVQKARAAAKKAAKKPMKKVINKKKK